MLISSHVHPGNGCEYPAVVYRRLLRVAGIDSKASSSEISSSLISIAFCDAFAFGGCEKLKVVCRVLAEPRARVSRVGLAGGALAGGAGSASSSSSMITSSSSSSSLSWKGFAFFRPRAGAFLGAAAFFAGAAAFLAGAAFFAVLVAAARFGGAFWTSGSSSNGSPSSSLNATPEVGPARPRPLFAGSGDIATSSIASG